MIPEELEMLLEAKVQISQELRREFQDILQRSADSFNKQMKSDLTKIVNKATKDHGLQMEQEKKIVDNLVKSEEWFNETFQRLRELCGPALH